MKIKDELLSGKLVIHIESKEKMVKLMQYLQDKTNILWNGGQRPLDKICLWDYYSNNTCIWIENTKLTRSDLKHAKQSNEKIYKYNEIWESCCEQSIAERVQIIEEIIAERMQTIAGMLDIPMDTDIVLTKNGSKLIYTPHQLTNEGLLNFMGTRVNDILGNLLIGRYEIEQPRFKDRIKEGDGYYYIDTDGLVEWSYYNNYDFENRMIELGNFFETEEEASKYELKLVKKESD